MGSGAYWGVGPRGLPGLGLGAWGLVLASGYGSKLNQELDRRFWSMCPLTGVPFGVPFFDPLPVAIWCRGSGVTNLQTKSDNYSLT